LFVTCAELTGAFRDVQDDGGRRAIELSPEMGAPRRHLVDDEVDEIEHLESALVDIEPFVVEGHAPVSVG
jgi:hypothetical protein